MLGGGVLALGRSACALLLTGPIPVALAVGLSLPRVDGLDVLLRLVCGERWMELGDQSGQALGQRRAGKVPVLDKRSASVLSQRHVEPQAS